MSGPTDFAFGLSEDDLRLLRLFYPVAFKKLVEATAKNLRFVHYTGADTALKIVQNREVWMRRSSVMNDFLEIEYGLACLKAAFEKHRERFKRLFDGIFPGFSAKLIERFDGWQPLLRSDTYIACLSEHDASEDQLGRLSMWRAYGQNTGVAIVLNGGPFLRPSHALKAYTSPVAYLTPDEFVEEFDGLLSGIEAEIEFVKEKGEDVAFTYIFGAFRSAALCTKHPGFHEEREWRVIYSPAFNRSERVRSDIVSIAGVPQPICKIPLEDVPEEGLRGIEIPDFIERIIIGPTDHPHVIAAAAIGILSKAGVTDANKRIYISDIPLRR